MGLRDGSSQDHAQPSTSCEYTEEGKENGEASEPVAHDDADSPGLSYANNEGYVEPIKAIGRARIPGSETPNFVPGLKPQTEDRSLLPVGVGDEDQKQPHLWSDMEDDGNLGPVPEFRDTNYSNLHPEQSVEEYIHENVTQCRQSKAKYQLEYIQALA